VQSLDLGDSRVELQIAQFAIEHAHRVVDAARQG